MIKTWKTSATERLARQGKSKFRGLDTEKALARLQVLDAASTLDEIPPLASINLHKLTGNRKGQWAITINGPRRLVFTFRNGNAYDVEIIDYH